jgi:ferritin-like metal-binding protein YciE
MKAKVKTKSNKESNSSDYNLQDFQLIQLFERGLKEIYWCEKALTKALPRMIKKATSSELIEAIENHLTETESQVTKVEDVFKILNKKPQAKKCEAMASMIKEAEEIMKDSDKGAMCDVSIIAAAQKVEHFEIASYGTLRTFAQTLRLDKAASILEDILEEEKSADQKLTDIAESIVNVQAVSEVE